MKKLILVLAVVLLTSFMFVGCLPSWLPGIGSDPEPVMEAVATAGLDDEGTEILWSITNSGDVFIREYILTFSVYYPMKDYVMVAYEGEYLEVGAFHIGEITLVEYDTPEAVSVSWELFN